MALIFPPTKKAPPIGSCVLKRDLFIKEKAWRHPYKRSTNSKRSTLDDGYQSISRRTWARSASVSTVALTFRRTSFNQDGFERHKMIIYAFNHDLLPRCYDYNIGNKSVCIRWGERNGQRRGHDTTSFSNDTIVSQDLTSNFMDWKDSWDIRQS